MRTLTTLFLFLWLYQSNAQVDSYDISSYVTPDYKYQALEITPDIEFVKSSFGQRRFEAEGGINYNRRKLTRKKISTTDFSFFMEHDKSQTLSDTTRNWLMIGSLYDRRQLFYKKKRFVTLDTEGDLLYIGRQNIEENDYLGTATVKIKPHWGMGRAELVTDAWHAKSIIKALQAKGLIKSNPSSKELEALAQKITEIKNTRVMDFRFDRIYEMEQLAVYLGEQGLVETDNFSFFATLNDAWLYEGFRTRRSGSHWQIGPTIGLARFGLSAPLVTVSGGGNTSLITPRSETSYGIETIYEKYISKGDFQFDFRTSFLFLRNRRAWDDDNIDDTQYSTFDFDASLDVHYLLSSRVNVAAAIEARVDDTDFGRALLYSGLDFDVQYFIAPRIALTWNTAFSINKRRRDPLRDYRKTGLSMRYILL